MAIIGAMRVATALVCFWAATLSFVESKSPELVPDERADVEVAQVGFSHTFWDPHWFTPTSTTEQAEYLTRSASEVGIQGVILAWSARQIGARTVAAYPADPSLEFGRFNSAIPRMIDAAKTQGLDVWMGLLAAPDVFKTEELLNKDSTLEQLSSTTLRLADDLFEKYGDDIDGWYIPIEPNELTVRTQGIAERHGRWLATMTAYLHSHNGNKPVMVSPSMPRAIFDSKSAVEFVEGLVPMMRTANVDIWNLQDGYRMTAWSPDAEARAFVRAHGIAAEVGTTVWASIYTPTGPAPNLYRYLAAIAATGTLLTEWTFSEFMNPDESRPGWQQKRVAYDEYASRFASTSLGGEGEIRKRGRN